MEHATGIDNGQTRHYTISIETVLPSGFFRTKFCMTFLFAPTHATCPIHRIFANLVLEIT